MRNDAVKREPEQAETSQINKRPDQRAFVENRFVRFVAHGNPSIGSGDDSFVRDRAQ